MGMMYASNQEKAAKFLVQVLNEHGGKVHYKYFYDATDAVHKRLCDGIGISEEDGEYYCVESWIDEAAYAMELQGYVDLNWLDGELLEDGELAYEIVLTPEGKRMFAAGKFPAFRDLDL